MDREEKIYKTIFLILFLFCLYRVYLFETKNTDDRFDKMEKELLKIHYELKTK